MTLNDRLEQFFKARPNVWVDGHDLAQVAGFFAWRSRCSDLRRLRGMVIENEVTVVKKPNGTRYTVSRYRYVAPSGQLELRL